MALQINRTDIDFQKVVFESVESTLAGGIILDLTDYQAAVNGMVPAGTLVGVNTTTGLGRVITEPAAPGKNIQLIGLTINDVSTDSEVMAGVVISGTARLKALPANERSKLADIRTALPKLTIL